MHMLRSGNMQQQELGESAHPSLKVGRLPGRRRRAKNSFRVAYSCTGRSTSLVSTPYSCTAAEPRSVQDWLCPEKHTCWAATPAVERPPPLIHHVSPVSLGL